MKDVVHFFLFHYYLRFQKSILITLNQKILINIYGIENVDDSEYIPLHPSVCSLNSVQLGVESYFTYFTLTYVSIRTKKIEKKIGKPIEKACLRNKCPKLSVTVFSVSHWKSCVPNTVFSFYFVRPYRNVNPCQTKQNIWFALVRLRFLGGGFLHIFLSSLFFPCKHMVFCAAVVRPTFTIWFRKRILSSLK